jgi:UDP-glucose 4-epimerase
METKVLVTGASGLIGRELCEQLADNFHVVAIDNQFRYDHTPRCAEFIAIDVQNYLDTCKEEFVYIFHMGAINGTKYFYSIPNTVLTNNIGADQSVLRYAEKHTDCKVIYASSSEVIADTDVFPTPEQTDVTIKDIHNPRWSYRLAKLVGENHIVNSNINYVIVRFFNVFGPASASGHFIRDILEKIDCKDYRIIGPNETRSFCRVEDAVDAVLNVFDKVTQTTINIGSDEELTVLEAANIITRAKGLAIDWKSLPGNYGSVTRRCPDITKLKSIYPQYNPKKFKDSIQDLWKQNNES